MTKMGTRSIKVDVAFSFKGEKKKDPGGHFRVKGAIGKLRRRQS